MNKEATISRLVTGAKMIVRKAPLAAELAAIAALTGTGVTEVVAGRSSNDIPDSGNPNTPLNSDIPCGRCFCDNGGKNINGYGGSRRPQCWSEYIYPGTNYCMHDVYIAVDNCKEKNPIYQKPTTNRIRNRGHAKR